MPMIVLWFPLLSSLVSGLVGRKIGVTGSNILSVIYLLISVLSLIVLINISSLVKLRENTIDIKLKK